jgi:hypothetical protein
MGGKNHETIVGSTPEITKAVLFFFCAPVVFTAHFCKA